MTFNRKCSAPSTSKQIGSKVQDVYDVEKLVKTELKKAGLNSEPTNKDKYVFFLF